MKNKNGSDEQILVVALYFLPDSEVSTFPYL